MYNIKITAQAKKELKLIKQTHESAINLAIEDIQEDPFAGKPLNRELTGHYSYRVGAYRIIYKVNLKDKIVIILTAGHRATIYQK